MFKNALKIDFLFVVIKSTLFSNITENKTQTD